MKIILLFCLFISLNFFGVAQIKTSPYISDTTYTIVEQQEKQPYLLPTMQLIINSDQVTSSFLLSSSGYKHHYHAMVIRLDPHVKLITLTELFTLYHIQKKYWHLPVSSNKNDFVYKSSAMVSTDAIIEVKVTKRDNTNDYYINITTKDKPNPNAIG